MSLAHLYFLSFLFAFLECTECDVHRPIGFSWFLRCFYPLVRHFYGTFFKCTSYFIEKATILYALHSTPLLCFQCRVCFLLKRLIYLILSTHLSYLDAILARKSEQVSHIFPRKNVSMVVEFQCSYLGWKKRFPNYLSKFARGLYFSMITWCCLCFVCKIWCVTEIDFILVVRWRYDSDEWLRLSQI